MLILTASVEYTGKIYWHTGSKLLIKNTWQNMIEYSKWKVKQRKGNWRFPNK